MIPSRRTPASHILVPTIALLRVFADYAFLGMSYQSIQFSLNSLINRIAKLNQLFQTEKDVRIQLRLLPIKVPQLDPQFPSVLIVIAMDCRFIQSHLSPVLSW